MTRLAYLASVRPRLAADQVAQPFGSSNACWAAFTARSTSSGPPSGAVAITSPVAGLIDVEGLSVGGVDLLAADDHLHVARGGDGLRFRSHAPILGAPQRNWSFRSSSR